MYYARGPPASNHASCSCLHPQWGGSGAGERPSVRGDDSYALPAYQGNRNESFRGIQLARLSFRGPGAYDMAGHKCTDGPGGMAAEAVCRDNGGMVQILFSAGLVEFWSELQKPHYMRGGGSQKLPIWDPVGFTAGLSADELKTKRQAETNNGRLAMIGAAGFWSATYLDGSVPALTGTAFFQS